jgi:hypothetical protein
MVAVNNTLAQATTPMLAVHVGCYGAKTSDTSAAAVRLRAAFDVSEADTGLRVVSIGGTLFKYQPPPDTRGVAAAHNVQEVRCSFY